MNIFDGLLATCLFYIWFVFDFIWDDTNAIVDNWYTGEHVPITLSRGQPGRDQQWVTDNNTILDAQIYLNDTIIN